jgi:dihydroxyacetone kinase DhaKLM complex PTS-EIIA-like component DhaM
MATSGALVLMDVDSARERMQCARDVLDEELLVWFQRNVDGEIERDFAAVA